MAIEVVVEVGQSIKDPPPIGPYLTSSMETAVELVRQAGERSIAASFQPSRQTSRMAAKAGHGYGPLHGSLEKVVLPSKRSGVTGVVRTDVFYSRFLEYGTRPFDIVAGAPRRGRQGRRRGRARARATRGRHALAFGNPLVFRPRVHHPGIRARHWMRTAAESETGAIAASFESATRQWAGTFSSESRGA